MKPLPEGDTLVFADPHIHKNSLEELSKVFQEIYDIAEEKKPTYIVCVGDWYDEKNLNPEVLTFGTVWVKMLAEKCSHFIMLRGNHPTLKSEVTSVDYTRWIKANGLIWVEDEFTIGNTLYAHAMTEKSDMCYNGELKGNTKYERHTDTLKEYDLVVLGHQHWKQFIEPNIWHLCSCRYVTFGEVDEDMKYVGFVRKGELELIPLTSPYLMIDIRTVEEADAIELPKITKVRFVVDDFKYLKENIDRIEKLKDKFFVFKRKLNFVDKTVSSTKSEDYQKKSLQCQIETWLNSIEDEEVKKILIEELKDSYNVY